jgi:hypothetical protein
MARKRKPLEINGATVDLNAPGLQLVERLGGVIQQYWVASPDARRRGYQPRTVRLHYDLAAPAGRADLERRCAVLTNEMLAWLGDPEGQGRPVYDGTIAALIKCYQTDARSPYQGLKRNTQRGYDDWCRTLERAIGKRRVDRLGGQDMRDCFLSLLEPAHPGGAPRVRLAQACVRSMMKILLNYGAELGLPGCLELVQVLERMTLRVPRRPARSGRRSSRRRSPCPTTTRPRSSPKALLAERDGTARSPLGSPRSSNSRFGKSTS